MDYNKIQVRGRWNASKDGRGFDLHISKKLLLEVSKQAKYQPDDAMITLRISPDDTDFGAKVRRQVAKILLAFSMPANIRGYRYIIEAVILELSDSGTRKDKYGQIYQCIAKQFKTTASGVERSIRRAIELTWSYGDMDEINAFFGNNFCYSKDKPSNSDFISKISEILKVKDLV